MSKTTARKIQTINERLDRLERRWNVGYPATGHLVAIGNENPREWIKQQQEQREAERWDEVHKIEKIIDRIPRSVAMKIYDLGIRAEQL